MYGFASVTLAPQVPDLSFEIRCESEEFLSQGKSLLEPESNAQISFTHVDSLLYPPNVDKTIPVSVFMIRNLLWNWADDDVVALLRSFLPVLTSNSSARILITDGVSPLPNQFPSHVEIAYRRRDITTMTMHNVKQRTQTEWLELFGKVDRCLKVRCPSPDVGFPNGYSFSNYEQVNTYFDQSSHVCKGLWELSLMQ